jgi:hypothetical protein
MSHRLISKICLLMLGSVVFASGCGGGSNGGVGVGGTGNTSTPNTAASTPVTASGPITGFGSVIINGIRFDDSSALVVKDATGLAASALRLGMTVEVTGTKNADGLTGTAERIRVYSELKGPVQAINLATNTLTILGSAINIAPGTVIEGAADLTLVKVNDIVEAYGLRNLGTGEISATRLEIEPIAPGSPPTVSTVTLNGMVQNINSVSNRFSVNGQLIDHSNATLSGVLGNGVSVRIIGTILSTSTVLAAQTISVLTNTSPAEGRQIEIEGIVSNYVNRAQFKINGSAVDASNGSLSATAIGRLANGARCQAKGLAMNGIVIATFLDCSGGSSNTIYEISGAITTFASRASFVVRGQTIDATNAIFSNGNASNLAVGRRVEIKGPVSGGLLRATSVSFE